MTGQTASLTVGITAGISALTAIVVVIITYVLTRKREHEADWRKLKFGHYQEFVLALSGVVRERATPEAQRRYADAVNSMALVASLKVLLALKAFQTEISYMNKNRTDEKHDHALNVLIRAMRADVHPMRMTSDAAFTFSLLGLPPESD